jgi:hypothetical protein
LSVASVGAAACGSDGAATTSDAPSAPAATTATTTASADTAAAAPAATTAATEPAPAATTPEVATVKYINTGVSLGNTLMWIADEQGIDEKHQIDAQLIVVENPEAALSALLSGDANVFPSGWSSLANIQQKGEDVRWACVGVPSGATTILAKAGADLPTFESTGGDFNKFMAELAAKNVKWAVNGRGGEFELRARALAAAGGVDAESFEYVPVALGPATIAALLNGDIDVMIGAGLSRQQIVGDGSGQVLWDEGKNGPPVSQVFNYVGYAVKNDWANDNADVLNRYCDLLREAKAFLQDPANSEVVVTMLKDHMGLTQDAQIALALDGLQNDWFPLSVPTESFDEAVDFFIASGVLQPEPRPTAEGMTWP